MRRTVLLGSLAALFILAPGAPSQESPPDQKSAAPAVAVLDVPWVWRNWTEYVEIINYVERIKALDRTDLEKMRDEALDMAKEADERYKAGELLEKDYRIQKAAIGARLRKLQNYWEIREEIIEKRLDEDEQKRLDRMQEAVDDIGFSGTPFILKGRATAYYDESLELAPRISETLNELDRIEAEKAAETEEAAQVLKPSATEEAVEPAPGPGAEEPGVEEPAAGSSPGDAGAETGAAESAPKEVPSEPAAEEAGSATGE
jgi:hypothetical protein